jgi:hypothetical protein
LGSAAGCTGAGIMLAAPALAGATVCAVARRNPYYDGGCGAPIGAVDLFRLTPSRPGARATYRHSFRAPTVSHVPAMH